MFAIHCPIEATEVLIWSAQVRQIRNDAHGIHLAFRCHCGTTAVLHTGRAVGGESVLHHRTRADALAETA